jgi:predicted transcriptional regulator
MEMTQIIELASVREKKRRVEITKKGLRTLEGFYQRCLTADEEESFAMLSEDDQIAELIYRVNIAYRTNLAPWATDEEVEAYNKKYFFNVII